MDSGGRGRPRVLYDTSRALKSMSLSVFKMDMYLGNTDSTEKEEVHRFIVTDEQGQPIRKGLLNLMAKRVHDFLMDVS